MERPKNKTFDKTSGRQLIQRVERKVSWAFTED